MSRKPRVRRTPEEKWQIVLEGLKSGNVAETCRKYEIAPKGNEGKLVAETRAISRWSFYYRRQPRASRADRSHDQEIILACGEKPAYSSA
jgi:hypothetical protein